MGPARKLDVYCRALNSIPEVPPRSHKDFSWLSSHFQVSVLIEFVQSPKSVWSFNSILFTGDIRELDVPEHPSASQTLVDKMETLVKKLTQKNFDVNQAHNPYLHAVWKEIENAALNLPRDDEEFLDFTRKCYACKSIGNLHK